MDSTNLVLERFHVALVASIERANPNYLRESFTVSEIYEDLIPYRTHRDLIGVAMNGDYEDGLMRLLAGESNYLILGSPEARDALVKELEKPAPDTALFKEYASVEVRLNPDLVGAAPPTERIKGVASLFKRGTGERTGTRPAGRWGLDAPDVDAHPQSAQEPAPVESRDPEPQEKGRASPVAGAGSGADEVGSVSTFWMESASPLPGSPAPSEPAGGERADRLEVENRRLKILLAERVLEVEELRERLKKGDAGALQGDL